MVTDVIEENLHAVDSTAYDEADRAFAADLTETFDPGKVESTLEELTAEDRETVEGKSLHAPPVAVTDADTLGAARGEFDREVASYGNALPEGVDPPFDVTAE